MALTRPTLQNINTNLTTFSDSLVVVNFANVANRDIGTIYDRSLSSASNVALVWQESRKAFTFAYTTSSGLAAGNIVVSSNANISAGNVFASSYFYSNGNVFSGGGTGTGITYTASTAPPVSGNIAGDQWYSTSSDVLYEFQYDGTSYYWVDITGAAFGNSSSGGGGGLPTGNLLVSGYIIPDANVTYDLGTTTSRWRSLYLSGNTIDLGGATIKTDSTSGAIALVPQPTVEVPNPTALVISSSGGLATAATTDGVISANAFANASAAAAPAVSVGKVIAMSMIFGG